MFLQIMFTSCSLVVVFGVMVVLIWLGSYTERYLDSYPSAM